MGQTLPINFTIGAFPIGFRGNCQDYANALVERLNGTIQLGTSGTPVFSAQYGGPQPSTDIGPWWSNGTDLYVFDHNTGQYQPMEDQTPIGACILWGGAGTPDRYLLCDGRAVSRTQYSRLYQRIADTWSTDDTITGGSSFNLPPGGRYLVGAGYDPLADFNFNNGQTGGYAYMSILPANLPPLSVHIYATNPQLAQGDTRTTILSSSSVGGANIGATESVVDGVLGTPLGAHIPLPVQPSFAAMNLCIRYT